MGVGVWELYFGFSLSYFLHLSSCTHRTRGLPYCKCSTPRFLPHPASSCLDSVILMRLGLQTLVFQHNQVLGEVIHFLLKDIILHCNFIGAWIYNNITIRFTLYNFFIIVLLGTVSIYLDQLLHHGPSLELKLDDDSLIFPSAFFVLITSDNNVLIAW